MDPTPPASVRSAAAAPTPSRARRCRSRRPPSPPPRGYATRRARSPPPPRRSARFNLLARARARERERERGANLPDPPWLRLLTSLRNTLPVQPRGHHAMEEGCDVWCDSLADLISVRLSVWEASGVEGFFHFLRILAGIVHFLLE